MPISTRYRRPALPERKLSALVSAANEAAGLSPGSPGSIASATSECVFYLEHSEGAQLDGLAWLLAETFEPENYGEASFLSEVCGAGLCSSLRARGRPGARAPHSPSHPTAPPPSLFSPSLCPPPPPPLPERCLCCL